MRMKKLAVDKEKEPAPLAPLAAKDYQADKLGLAEEVLHCNIVQPRVDSISKYDQYCILYHTM